MIRRLVAAVACVVGLLAGLCLMLAPFALGNQPGDRDWTRSTTVTVASGGAVALVGLIGLVAAAAALVGLVRRYGTTGNRAAQREPEPGARRAGGLDPIADAGRGPGAGLAVAAGQVPATGLAVAAGRAPATGLAVDAGRDRGAGASVEAGRELHVERDLAAGPAAGARPAAAVDTDRRHGDQPDAAPAGQRTTSPAELLAAVLPALIADLTVDGGPGSSGGTAAALPGSSGGTAVLPGSSSAAVGVGPGASETAVGGPGSSPDDGEATIGQFPRRPSVGVNGRTAPAWPGFLHPAHERTGSTVADAVGGRGRALRYPPEEVDRADA